jgi:hypothetical protein
MEILLTSVFRFAADSTAKVNCIQASIPCETGLPKVTANSANLQAILQITFGVLAIMAVVIIVVWGGLRLIAEGNNPQQVTKARNTIIYATVGLVIAISGELIVSFVLNRL